jgi:hypothetical protein
VLAAGQRRLAIQTSSTPAAKSAAPRYAHGVWRIMKLRAGYGKEPVPWPIQTRPVRTARTPTTSNAIFMVLNAVLMDFYATALPVRKRAAGAL